MSKTAFGRQRSQVRLLSLRPTNSQDNQSVTSPPQGGEGQCAKVEATPPPRPMDLRVPLTGWPKGQVVYFMQAAKTRAIKIGTTRNLRSRYRALNTMAPHGINRVWYLAGAGRTEEVALHREFKDQRIGGEWFDPCRAILAKIIYGGCCEVRRIAGRVTGQVCSWDLP